MAKKKKNGLGEKNKNWARQKQLEQREQENELKPVQNSQKSSRELIYATFLLLLFGVLVYFFLTGGFGTVKGSETNVGTNINTNTSTNAGQTVEKGGAGRAETGSLPQLSKSYSSSLPYLGHEAAGITVVEFGDYQCEFCTQFYSDTEKQVRENYINTQKVKFYYRDFPQTNIHDKAFIAAEAARCANEQGKFWEMHDMLYEKRNDWAIQQKSKASSEFTDYAKEIGLEGQKFSACMQGERYKNDINKDLAESEGIGIGGTPTFMVYIPKDRTTRQKIESAKTKPKDAIAQDDKNYIVIIEGYRTYHEFSRLLDVVN